jgi:hypothetical protein
LGQGDWIERQVETTIARDRQLNFISDRGSDFYTPKLYPLQKSSDNGAFSLHRSSNESLATELDQWSSIKKVIRDPWCHSILPDISNLCSVFGNAGSALSHLIKVPDNIRILADTIASFGTKFFLYTNATIKTLEELSRHNYLVAFGYFMDNLIATFIPQEYTFLARGVSSGTYHGGLALNMLNNKIKFKNFSEHLLHLKDSFKMLITKVLDKNIFNNLFVSNNAIPGAIGGLLSVLGVVIWPLFGRKAGTIVRDIGGLIKAGNYANPDNLRQGRNLLFSSGLMQIFSLVADCCGGQFKSTRSYMVPISLGLDGFSKYIQRQSINKGELGEI